MLSLFTSFLAVAALPAALGAPTSLFRRAVSEELFTSLNLYEQYAAASYCTGNNNSTGTKVTCDAGICPLVEAATTTTLTEFENSLITDVTGFVVADDTNQVVVVSIRGTSSVRNYIADANFLFTDADEICDDCKVHTGFYTSWQEAKVTVLTAIKDAATKYPSYAIVTTGHSLGAAIATLATAEMRIDGYSVDLYSYGSPRVGNDHFAEQVSLQAGESYRVTHSDDLIPKLPPQIFGYHHIYDQYWITTGNDVSVTANDIEVFEGEDADDEGNADTDSSDIAAHRWYFNGISSCEGESNEFKKRDIVRLNEIWLQY